MRTGGTPEPGSAREEAERLVAAALAMAQTAVTGARYGAGARDLVGTVGQVISDVLDQVVPSPTAAPGPSPTADPPGEPRAAGPAGEPRAAGPGERTTGATATETAGAAGDDPSRHGFATGGPACCVCPVCRAIGALRDPSPELVERLATGAGDLAAGVASLLRAFSTVANPTAARHTDENPTENPTGPQDRAPATEPDSRPSSPRVVRDVPGGVGEGHADAVWREATRTGHDSGPAVESDVWAAATRAAGTAPATGQFSEPDRRSTASGTEPTDRTGPAGPAGRRPSVPASRAPEGPVDAAAEPGTSDGGA
ncbi:hypothetical protein [Plantactinospora sp. B24E8]|uniref:hypothetical protein n=1 Tax=Plantactinospora sp. B24E8 TaxID=3153567 RepID=UPI00325D0B47